MKLFLLSLFTIFNSLFADYLDVQFASFSYTIGGSYGSCVKFKKSEYSFSDFNECSCAWAANVSNYSDCYELYYNPQTKMIKYNLSEGGEYTYRNFSNDYTCHIYNEEMTILECSEFNEIGCDESSECEWVESIEYQSCGIYTLPSDCSAVDGCYWYAGSYYPAFQGCNGEFEVDSSYCEEMEFQLGDINFDGIINIQDIIQIIDMILTNQYNDSADINDDGNVNILDVLQIVDYIINS